MTNHIGSRRKRTGDALPKRVKRVIEASSGAGDRGQGPGPADAKSTGFQF